MDDKPSIQLDTSVDEALRTVARSILADARAAIQNLERATAEAVHEFRRQMKRWRALLRLLGPFLGADGKQLRNEVAHATHSRRSTRSPISKASICPSARSPLCAAGSTSFATQPKPIR